MPRLNKHPVFVHFFFVKPKPTTSKTDLFADCPLAVRQLAAKASQERRKAARAKYAKANGLNLP